MDFDMEQHEVVFNCTKRALEGALFSYTLSANEVYDAALIYTGDEKNVNRNASTAGFKNIYARTLMKTMNCFCVNPCKNLSFEVLASGPKIYDNIYQENRWHTYFEVLKTIHIEMPDDVERKNLMFSEVVLYLTLLTNGGKFNKAWKKPITSPFQKNRARKWLERIAKGMFSDDMQKVFRTILLWLIEDELIHDFDKISYSLITEFGLSEEKVEKVMKQKNTKRNSNLYRDFTRAEEKGKTFLYKHFEGKTDQETEANLEKYQVLQEKRYLYWKAIDNIIWVANLVACQIIPNNISKNDWQDSDKWFLQKLIDSPDYPADLAEKLESEIVEIQRAQQRSQNLLNQILKDVNHQIASGRPVKSQEPYTNDGYMTYVPTWLEYQEGCWLAKVITSCAEAATKEACLMLSAMPRTHIYETETLYDYLKEHA